MKRVALYIRVSTEEQAMHGLSIEAQTVALDAWAKANKCKVVDHYVDAGISARKKAAKRPSLQRLLDDIRSGKIDLIVFTKLDRWFRNIAEYYKVQEVLEKHHVDWKTIHEDYDTSTASGRLKINIMLSVAQDEADRTSERIKSIFESKLSRNEPLNGKAPYGYKNENKQIVIDDQTAPMVKAAFDAYLKTGAINKMIAAAPDLHLTYKRSKAMLQSTAYIGDWCGISVEPILSKRDYDVIQSMQKRNVRKTKENRIYLFSGLLVCAECGRRLGGRVYKRTHCETAYYVCQGHYLYKGCSVAKSFREDAIEQYLLDHAEEKNRLILEWADRQVTRDYSKDRLALKRKLSKLSELYVNDLVGIEDYKRQYADLTAQLDEIPEDIQHPRSDKTASLFYSGWKDAYEELSRSKKQEFWRLTVREIKIYSTGRIDFDLLI